MIMRAVTVTIAPGKEADYWAWAREIVELWDAKGVRRAGGPYRSREGDQEVGLWLTLHDDMTEIEDEFRTLYAEGVGKALIERRPALVSDTTVAYYDSWPFDA